MKFEPSSLKVFVCPHIFKSTRPILYVCREGGDLQCLCGEYDHDEKGHLVGVGHLQERDPSICQLADLPNDWQAERKDVTAEWIRSKCE